MAISVYLYFTFFFWGVIRYISTRVIQLVLPVIIFKGSENPAVNVLFSSIIVQNAWN